MKIDDLRRAANAGNVAAKGAVAAYDREMSGSKSPILAAQPPNVALLTPETAPHPTYPGFEQIQARAKTTAKGWAPEPESGNGEVRFTIPGNPIGKPRQTVSDRWKKRPCVLRYRAWADAARAAAPRGMTASPFSVEIKAFFEMPKSWGKKMRAAKLGQAHRQRPDLDNVIKCLDALFPDDSMIWEITAQKMWEDHAGPRLEITVR
jgi:Holliday junction resolvase RusA-like endonuclease